MPCDSRRTIDQTYHNLWKKAANQRSQMDPIKDVTALVDDGIDVKNRWLWLDHEPTSPVILGIRQRSAVVRRKESAPIFFFSASQRI